MIRLEYQILCALLLDLLVGDPRWLPHPVKIIGGTALRLENPLRRLIPHQRLAGAIAVSAVVGGTVGAASLLLHAAALLHPVAEDIVGTFLIYTAIAARDLGVHATRVHRALRCGDITAARAAVGMIVGRDTDRLTEPEIVRATVETVAENLVDGVTAPLLFAFLAGPLGALGYKAVNTLDSTFGYRTERYLRFGWASARLDDLANWIPARLTAPCVAAAAWLVGLSPANALRILRRDRRKHDSPNAGLTEAAFAGALRVQLGGVNSYFGVPHPKPTLGEPHRPLVAGHILKAEALMYASTGLFTACCLGISLTIG